METHREAHLREGGKWRDKDGQSADRTHEEESHKILRSRGRSTDRRISRELRMPANIKVRVERMAIDDPDADYFDDRPLESKDELAPRRGSPCSFPYPRSVQTSACVERVLPLD